MSLPTRTDVKWGEAGERFGKGLFKLLLCVEPVVLVQVSCPLNLA